MGLLSATQVDCPACGKSNSVQVVRSLNTDVDPALKEALLRGELNLLRCGCGKATLMEADLVFHDPQGQFFCQVCVGDASAIARSKKAFEEAGVTRGRRIVRSLNALAEKVKLLDAGLEDWAIEMVKVLLLASMQPPQIDQTLLFDSIDRERGLLGWALSPGAGAPARPLSSPLAPYERALVRWKAVAPAGDEFEIDSQWALAALKKVMPLPA